MHLGCRHNVRNRPLLANHASARRAVEDGCPVVDVTLNGGFNYLGVNAGVESTNPQACCDTNTSPTYRFWYNPQAGSGGTWWMTEEKYGGPYPGTGQQCNAVLPKWQCSIGGQNMPSCQDTDIGTAGAQPFDCPPDMQLDMESSNSAPSVETCCVLLHASVHVQKAGLVAVCLSILCCCCAGSVKSQSSNKPQPFARSRLHSSQPFNCKSLGDFVPNENVTNVGPADGSICCRPRYSCIDVNPSVYGCQPFYCDTDNGWYPNQDTYYLPNPSPEVCCKRSTCADKDVFKRGTQQQRCPVGTEYDPSKANVSPPNRRRCCKAVPTCSDTEPATPGVQSWYCDPARGLAQNPNAAAYPNPSDSVCCVPLTRPTCGDFDISTAGVQPWPCPPLAAANPAASSLSPPSNTACCLRTCADTDVTTATAEPYVCPAGETPNRENALLSPPSNSMCCTLPSPSPAEPSPSPAEPSPPPAVPSPPPASPSPAVPSPALPTSPTPPSPAPGPSPPPATEATCGDVDLVMPGMQPFQCPAGTIYNMANVNRNRPTTRRCCLATCSDRDLNNAGQQPWLCPEGTVSNPANSNFSPPSNSRLLPAIKYQTSAYGLTQAVDSEVVHAARVCLDCPLQPTCADKDVNRRNNQAWVCPSGAPFIAAKAQFNPPSNAACCTNQPQPRRCTRASPALAPSPSPVLPASSPSPSPAPVLVRLALLSEFPGGYSGPTANISAMGAGSCVEEPSTRLEGSVTPTCLDTDVTTRANESWTCPEGSSFNAANAAYTPPSEAACCV
ncbi:hypothetical protein COO60DRAFT_1459047, partial [Scenedesmus sp. NREL 46B-D3]